MKVFVAGATGALGNQLVPMLVANGHEVVGMTRTETKRDQLRSSARSPWWPTRWMPTPWGGPWARQRPK